MRYSSRVVHTKSTFWHLYETEVTVRLLFAVILSVTPMHVLAEDCLHGTNETSEQRARRVETPGADL